MGDADVLVGRVRGLHEYYDIRALNTDSVPELVVGELELILRDDGRFGREDHLQWPQYFCAEAPSLALLPRRPHSGHPAAVLWQAPQRGDFTRANNHPDGEAFGSLHSEVLSTLDRAINIIRPKVSGYRDGAQVELKQLRQYEGSAAILPEDRLEYARRRDALENKLAELANLEARLSFARAVFGGPSTFTMCLLQWGHLHRCFAECWAWLEWQRVAVSSAGATTTALHPGLDGSGVIGAFCDNNNEALRLYRAGVPVWLVTPTMAASSRLPPKTLPLLQAAGSGVVLTRDGIPMTLSRRVAVGIEHVRSLRQLSSSVFDFERASVYKFIKPLSEHDTIPRTVPPKAVGKGGKATVPSGKERFVDKLHDLLPRRIAIWQEGLVSVDLTRPRPDDADRLGLWLPEAEFLVTVQTNRRLFTQLCNWLRYRCAVINSLDGPSRYKPPRSASWRALLCRFPKTNDDPDDDKPAEKKRRKEKEEAYRFFGELFNEEIGRYADLPDAILWRGHELRRDAFLDNRIEPYKASVQELAWELSQVAFRVELHELDRFQVPPPAQGKDHFKKSRRELLAQVFGDGHHLRPTLPPTSAVFGATDIRSRAARLDALRRLLCRWPGHPSHFDGLVFQSPSISESSLSAFEREAAKYYCQQFYEWAGRAPAIPRMAPL